MVTELATMVGEIAVSSPARNRALPDVPAMGELPALKGAESDLWYGMLVAAGTDRRIALWTPVG